MSIARMLLAGMIVATVGALTAQAQTGSLPARTFTGWFCEIDLGAAGAGTGSLFTFDTFKQCSGSASNQNAKIECKAPVPGWSAGATTTRQGFPCQIFLGQCGQQRFVMTNTSSLKVDSSGVATLTCQFN